MNRKILAFLIIVLLILNMVLFAMGKLSDIVFWTAIGLSAVIAFKFYRKK